MYKQATKEKLRFQTVKGLLSTEQLWDLSIESLNDLAVKLDDEYKNSGKKSFIAKKSKKDKTLKLKFDIVFDILGSKVDDREIAQELTSNKAHNQKIMDAIYEAENRDLKSKSVEELKQMLK